MMKVAIGVILMGAACLVITVIADRQAANELRHPDDRSRLRKYAFRFAIATVALALTGAILAFVASN